MTKDEAKNKFMELIQEEDKETYTQADFDRAVSKLHEEFKKDHEQQLQKKLEELEVIAEAEAQRKFKPEHDEHQRHRVELSNRMTENNLRLMEELTNKVNGKSHE